MRDCASARLCDALVIGALLSAGCIGKIERPVTGTGAPAQGDQILDCSPGACDALPVAALLADLARYEGIPSTGMSDGEVAAALAPSLGLGEAVSCVVFGLLDQATNGVDDPRFPALSGLDADSRRLTILLAVVRLGGFDLSCALARQVIHGASRSVGDLARLINHAQGEPVTDDELNAFPFERKMLPWEIARALDDGLGQRLTHGGTVVVRGCPGFGETTAPAAL